MVSKNWFLFHDFLVVSGSSKVERTLRVVLIFINCRGKLRKVSMNIRECTLFISFSTIQSCMAKFLSYLTLRYVVLPRRIQRTTIIILRTRKTHWVLRIVRTEKHLSSPALRTVVATAILLITWERPQNRNCISFIKGID